MTTIDRLKTDQVQAMKAKENATRDTIRLILAAIQREAQDIKDKAVKAGKPVVELTEEDVLRVVQKFKDNIREELEAFAKRGDTLKVQQLDDSLIVVERYLPVLLNAEEVFAFLQTKIVGATNQGEARKLLGNDLKGKADNRTISEQIERFLKG